VRLGVPYHEEGIIALGHPSERWRLTDNLDCLLFPDDQFIAGGSRREIKEALEERSISPVPGVSMVEICEEGDLKLHTMPFADSVLYRVTKNHPQYSWGEKYIKHWLPDPVATLTKFCLGGEDMLISTEVEERLREDADFWGSDLVIGKRDTWYSIVKYRPAKAAARRKTKTTITKKEQHASNLVEYARKLRVAASDAYTVLRAELVKFGLDQVLVKADANRTYGSRHSNGDDRDSSTTQIVQYIRALLPIHAAFLGKHAYRYNDDWQEYLQLVRDRPKDLGDNDWGNYQDVKQWLEAECRLRKLKPTATMLAAAAEAEAKKKQSLTCASCGTVMQSLHDLYAPPSDGGNKYAAGAKLCSDCWEVKFDVPATDTECA
jgi:hypothetical protein